MNELKAREIFAVGTWNGIDFSEADLDDIVENFTNLIDTHKVPLKFGHNDEQPITDGQPAIGWVERIYRDGKKLLADFANVPSVVVDAIKNKLYRTVSVELLFNVDNKGKKYNHVLDAVAILGADQPAVNNLADLNTLLAKRTAFSGGHRVVFNTMKGERPEINSKEEFEMDKKEIQEMVDAAIAPLKTEIVDLKAERDTLKQKNEKLEADQKDREKAEQQEKIAASRKAVTTILDEAVKEKRMTPAVRETYSKQIGVDDDKRVIEIDLDQVKLMCGATKGPDTKEQGHVADKDDDKYADVDNPGEKLMRMTRDYQADKGEDNFEVAFSRVANANPELHKAYLMSNGEE